VRGDHLFVVLAFSSTLLAVSGQNVALLAAGVLGAAWLLGLSRVIAELGAVAAIGAYVLAVGAQPSVVRAGVAGALGSLAWLTARGRDRWYFMLLGALVLLAWNPYDILDAGFQLSFAAVGAIWSSPRGFTGSWRATRCRAASPVRSQRVSKRASTASASLRREPRSTSYDVSRA
jgi:ComEC/Rec2-related protein